MSGKAPSYRWTCGACEAGNPAGNSSCEACGCPAYATKAILNEWKEYGRIRPQKPSIMPTPGLTFLFGPLLGRTDSLAEPVAYCHSCSLMMHLRDDECPHCGYTHSPPEKTFQREQAADYTGKGVWGGLIYWPIFFVMVATGFYLWHDI